MPKPKPTSAPPGLVYSTDRPYIVRLARGSGLSDAAILATITTNEYGAAKRRALIREWAPALGLSEKEALQIAKEAGLITR